MATRAIPDRLTVLLTLGDPRPEESRGGDDFEEGDFDLGEDLDEDGDGDDHEHDEYCGCGGGLTGGGPETWADYSALGITEEDWPGLIAVATDKGLLNDDGVDEVASFAPIHAWRALGKLRCEAAVKPLADLLDFLAKRDHEWGLEELPTVFAAIGPASLRELKRILPDQRQDAWARVAASRAMRGVAQAYPLHRDEVVRTLTDQLGLARFNEPYFNEMVVAELIELRAVEAEGRIRRVYEGGHVDETMCGNLEQALEELHRTPANK